MGSNFPALDIRPPEGILDQYGKAMQLKSLMGAQAAQAQSLEMGKLQLEEARRQQKESDTIRSLFQKNAGDLGKTIEDAAASGQVNPKTLMGLQEQHLKMQTDLATRDEKTLKNALDSGNLFAGALDTIKQMPLEQRPQGVKSQLAILAKQGIDVSKVAQTVQGLPDLSDETINGVEASLIGHNKAVEQEMARRKTAVEELQAQTAAKKLQAEMPGGALQDVSKAEMNDWLTKNPGKGPSDFMAYKAKLVPQFNFNLQSQGGPEVPLNDRQKNTAQAILEGRMKAPSGFALKTPYWQTVMGEVFKQDPQWSEQRAELRKSFTQDKEIGAINTALGHVGVMYDAIDALGNNNVKALNAIGNRLGIELGTGSAVTKFNTIIHRLGPELSKAYIAGGGSAGERGTDEKDFDPSLGPKLLKDNAAITAQLLRSKISSKAFQWDQNKTEGMPSFEDKFIMPEAKQVLEKLNPKGGGTIRARDTNGQLHEAPAGTKLPPGWKLEQ